MATQSGYELLVLGSVFVSNTADPGTLVPLGGAVFIACGTSLLTRVNFTNNGLSGLQEGASLASGGGLYVTNACFTADLDGLLVTSVSIMSSIFDSNIAPLNGGAVAVQHTLSPTTYQQGTILLTLHNTAQQGGAIFMEACSIVTMQGGALSKNNAKYGGGIFAASGQAQHTFIEVLLQGNSAAMGGGLFAGGNAAVSTQRCSFDANLATNGSAISVSQTASVNSTQDAFTANSASAFGGVAYVSSTANITFASVSASNNVASVSSTLFTAAFLSSLLDVSGHSNYALNYGNSTASLPSSLSSLVGSTLLSELLAVQSGTLLNLSFVMRDLYNQVVAFWQDFTADVLCLTLVSPGGSTQPCDAYSLEGATHATYFSSKAAFPTLAVSGPVNTTLRLLIVLASPTWPQLMPHGGLAVALNVSIAPCTHLQVFQALRCTCSPGTFLNGETKLCQSCAPGFYSASAGTLACAQCTPGSYNNAARTACTPCAAGTFLNASSLACQPCSPGSFSPAAGAVACTVNPPGFASSMQTTFASNVTLAGVSAASFGASQNSTLTATLAAALSAPATTIVITAVTSAAPSGRHLLQASAAVAFSVSTANATQASSLRSALNATAALAGLLTTTLRGSTDPVLSAVTGVVAALPAESNLVLAALPCPAGTYLNGLTQSCDQCAVGLVATSAGSTTCAKCPPRFAWVNSSLCSPCPDSSVTSPGNPAQCACSSGFYDSRFGASLAEPACKVCPLGGACETGLVGAAAGYWRENELSDAFVQCREGNCLGETVLGPLSMLEALPASGNETHEAGRNCVDGNNGPICGVCIPGYAMQSGVCAPCDPADAWDNWSPGSKAGLLIGCIIFAFIVLSFLFFQPLVPSLERSAVAIIDALKEVPSYALACLRACCCCCFAKRPQAAPVEEAKAKKAKKSSTAVTLVDAEENRGQAGANKKKKEDPNAAADFARNGNIASAVGNTAAFAGGGDGGSSDDDAKESSDDGGGGGDDDDENSDGSSGDGVEGNLDFLDWLEEFTEKLEKVSKVVIKCVL
jgi:hypothetical protein